MSEKVLVTGATGYVGGQLVARLLEQQVPVRVITRSADGLPQEWAQRVDVVEGDLHDRAVLDRALEGVTSAYYLVHSMDGEGDFQEQDRELATMFADAAEQAGVGRIVYLGGLHPDGVELSPHLASRVEVGEILLASKVPTAVLQAAIVLGHGSISFEMLRYLTTRLPAMIAPKWLNNRIQPIAVDDVVHYLVAARSLPAEVNRAFDVGGPDVMTYQEMMQDFAAVTGLRRRLIQTVPVLSPKLAAQWIGFITPVNADVAKPLVDSLVHEVVCGEKDLAAMVGQPAGGETCYRDAVQKATAGLPRDNALRIVAGVAAAVTASAALGTIATQPDSRWYKKLDKPDWQPPGPAFGIVWTALYATIAGVSCGVLVEADEEQDAQTTQDYSAALGANLVLNTAWSWLFWRSRRLDLAAAEASLLAVSSADLARRAAKTSKGRGVALAPYAAWCGFATVLSAEIARRNR